MRMDFECGCFASLCLGVDKNEGLMLSCCPKHESEHQTIYNIRKELIIKDIHVRHQGKDYLSAKERLVGREAIDAQSSVRLRFNREKLARTICNASNPSHPYDEREQVYKDIFLKYADAIIAAGADIVEVCND